MSSTALLLLRQLDTFLPKSARSERVNQAIDLALKADSVYHGAKDFYDRWQASRSYEIKVPEGDTLYYEILSWLFTLVPPKENRVITAKTERKVTVKPKPPAPGFGQASIEDDEHDDGEHDDGDEPKPASTAVIENVVNYSFPPEAALDVRIDGHAVRVEIRRTRQVKSLHFDELTGDDEVVLITRSRRAHEAVKEEIARRFAKASSNQQQKRTFVQTHGPYGWGQTNQRVTRDPSTVVLPAGQMERLSADLSQFLENKPLYQKNGFPYHRGYLLYGPPGTGKTSAAIALATELGLDVFVMLVSDARSDADLAQRISRIPAGSVLLLEDVDVAQSTNTRADSTGDPKPKKVRPSRLDEDEDEPSQTGVTLAGLLNVLDGAWTPDGLITIMTTNRKEALDPALLRAGRCDMVEEIDYLTDEQAARLVAVMTGQSCPMPSVTGRQIVPAQIAEIVKRHITDMDRARHEIVAFLNQFEEQAEERSA
jgi:hypothetical protein